MSRHYVGWILWFAASPIFAGSGILSNYRILSGRDSQLQAITEKYEIHREENGSYEVIVPANEFKDFLNLAPEAELIDWDIKSIFRRLDESEPGWREQYHKFNQVEAILQEYEKNFPNLVHLEVYGKSAQGRPLYALRLSAAPGAAPEIMLTAATHGDELITVEVLLAITEKLIKGYGTDPKINRILSSHTLYILPVINPDGFVSQDRYDNGRDPNRSYPWPQNPGAEPTPSIKAVMKFFQDHHFVGSIDFHASGKLLMYPWAYTEDEAETEKLQWFRTTTQAMAKLNGYRAGQISRILYAAPGSSADYYHWKNQTFALGIEMASSKVPSPSQIPNVIKENVESTLLFLEYF